MAENLKDKTVTGVVWSAFQKGGSILVSFVSTIVLARLLTPEDYGLIGMLAIFIAVSEVFINGGFGSALIQKKRPTDLDYSTFFIWNLTISVFLYGVLFLCAPLIARFYEQEILCSILRINGLILIINAVSLVQTYQLRKQLNFKKIGTIEVSVSVLSLIVCIYFAWKGYGVWALVIQTLFAGVLKTLAFWLSSKWRPMLKFSVQSFMELFSFGGFILLSNLVNTFCNNIQGLLIGKFYNPATMGYYSKARSTEQLSASFISQVIDQVAYPVLAEAQNDNAYMIRMLKKFIGVLAFLVFPTMLLLILLAKPVFVILYSDRWLPSVPYFQILCLAGLAICLQGINYYAVAAVGKSKDMFTWTLVKRGVGLVLVVGGLAVWGINGLLVGMVLTSFLVYFINAGLVSKHIGYTGLQQFRDLLPVILVSAASFFVAFLTGHFLHLNMYVEGAIQLVLFGTVYLGLSALFKLDAFAFTKDVVGGLIHKIRKK
jgi:O-antigen/teichoic acid export membrane protein